MDCAAADAVLSLLCRYEIDPSQELVALGTANIVGAMFQSIPAMGGFGLSAVNSGAGAKSQFSLLVSGDARTVECNLRKVCGSRSRRKVSFSSDVNDSPIQWRGFVETSA